MAWLDRIAARLGFARQPARRDFAAAQLNRLTGGWSSSNVSANADLYRNLDVLRARSRDLCNNNDYGKRFIGMVSANVVGGTGFQLQARVYDTPDKPDDFANSAIETAWSRWCRRGVCDVTGRLSFRDLQILLAKACARDGEALVRKVRGKTAGNPFGYALQVLDIDRLDTRLIRAAESGQNEIRMGVEIDAFGRSVAYWLRGYHPGDTYGMASGAVQASHIRVPSDEIQHVFLADRPEQLRGTPWMHAAMTRLNNLGGYEEAAVIAARVGASKMGFFTTPDGEPPKEGEDAAGVPYMEADPGSFGVLPSGTTFEPFNPDYPTAMYGDFIKACLRGIASGLGVAYHALANDLENVNFSSIRSGTIEERDQWISLQEWFKDAFIEPIYQEWLDSALAFGQIVTTAGRPLPLDKKEKFAGHIFQGRRWQWVDPKKDIEASLLAIRAGLSSPYSIASQMGLDLEDVITDLSRANKAAASAGLPAYAEKVVVQEKKPKEDSEEKKALRAMILRSLAQEQKAGDTVINNHPPAVTLNQGEVRNEITVQAPAAPNVEVRNEITERAQEPPVVQISVESPVVNVAAPEVTVEVEAIMPALSEIAIVSLPDRVTTTEVIRDATTANIKTTLQTEKDA